MSAYLGQLIGQSAGQYGVPANLFAAQLAQESSLNPNAFNASSGASGIAQFMPGTAAQFGVTNPFDPTQAVPAAAGYMSQLYQRTGSWLGALTGYGTLPSNPANYTASQAQLAGLASSIDAQGGQGGSFNPFANDPFALPTTPGAPGTTSALGQAAGQALGGFLTPLGAIGTWIERGLIVVAGIAILYGGIRAFGSETAMGRQASRVAGHVTALPRAVVRRAT